MTQSIQKPDQQETVRRLRAVTRRIEAFVESQAQRLEIALKQVDDTQQEFAVARRLSAELEQKRGEWEQDRKLELSRLTEASRALAKSWHELEQKQRDLELERNRTGGSSRSSGEEHKPVQSEHHARERTTSRPRVELGLFEMKQLQAQVSQHKRRSR